MTASPPNLTPRLKKIAEFITPCRCIADIGTDHAYLPVYLTMTGVCSYAIASDIRKGPLQRAKATVTAYAMEHSVELRLGGGAETLSANETDCIIIAGMGGLMISEILSASRSIFESTPQILLQPMTAADELREFLSENGYTITAEYLAKEAEKIYIIMSVRSDIISESYTPTELYLGKRLIETKPEFFDVYCQKQRRRLTRMIDGLKASKDGAQSERLYNLEKIIAEMDSLGI